MWKQIDIIYADQLSKYSFFWALISSIATSVLQPDQVPGTRLDPGMGSNEIGRVGSDVG